MNEWILEQDHRNIVTSPSLSTSLSSSTRHSNSDISDHTFNHLTIRPHIFE
jgi:hypothetical protein